MARVVLGKRNNKCKDKRFKRIFGLAWVTQFQLKCSKKRGKSDSRVKLLKDFLWLQERRSGSVPLHTYTCVHVCTHVLEGSRRL